MPPSPPRFWLDLVDPLSYLMEMELRAVESDGGPPVARSPFELRPPPEPLLDPDGPEWRERRRRAAALATQRGSKLAEPELVPWSRKAHELVLHAREVERETEMLDALLQAFHVDGRDIGRIDVLVGLARDLGLDMTHTKAVLDVDRHAAAVAAARADGQARGVTSPPALWTGDALVQGFHDRDALRTLLVP